MHLPCSKLGWTWYDIFQTRGLCLAATAGFKLESKVGTVIMDFGNWQWKALDLSIRQIHVKCGHGSWVVLSAAPVDPEESPDESCQEVQKRVREVFLRYIYIYIYIYYIYMYLYIYIYILYIYLSYFIIKKFTEH